MRKLLAIMLAFALLALTACGAGGGKSVGEAEPLSSIKVTLGADDNTAPTVTFDTPLTATAPGAKVVQPGDGAEIKEGHYVSYKLSGYNTETGEELGNTFTMGAQKLQLVPELKEADPEIYEILVGSKVGSWIAYVRPTAPAPGGDGSSESAAPSEPATASATEVLVMKVVASEEPPKTLEQPEVEQLEKDGALPTVEFAEDGNPTISIPEGKEEPGGLAVQVLEEGDGEVLTEQSTITADYEGIRWEDGEVFDSSYDRGEAASFPLTGVIQGWTEGLAGQKVGSKVLLTIPGSMAYDGSAGRPQGTLVFVVDIKSAE